MCEISHINSDNLLQQAYALNSGNTSSLEALIYANLQDAKRLNMSLDLDAEAKFQAISKKINEGYRRIYSRERMCA